MRRLMTLACCVAGLAPAQASAQESTPAQPPPVPEQIAQALAAAPEERADGATIMGFDAYGSLVVIRQGTNDLICLADDPSQEGFSVACYHDSLEPYMARGRALRDEGVSGMERMTQRWEEVEAGRLAMPEAPAMLYVVRGDAFDASTRSVQNRYERWVLYTPFATSASTGLSTSPTEAGTPWIMFPGTAGAHIMISPPQDP